MAWLFGNKSKLSLPPSFPPLQNENRTILSPPDSTSTIVSSPNDDTQTIPAASSSTVAVDTNATSSSSSTSSSPSTLSSSSIFIPRSWLTSTILPVVTTTVHPSTTTTKPSSSPDTTVSTTDETGTVSPLVPDTVIDEEEEYYSDEADDDDSGNDNELEKDNRTTTTVTVTDPPPSPSTASILTHPSSAFPLKQTPEQHAHHYSRTHRNHVDLLRALPILNDMEQRGVAGIFAYVLSHSLYTVESTLWSQSFYRDLCLYKLGVTVDILAAFDPLVGIFPRFDERGARIDNFQRSIRYPSESSSIRSCTSPNDPGELSIPFIDSLPTNPIIRYRILRDLQLLYVANDEYDARVRTVLRSVAHLLGIPWSKLGKCEDQIIQQLLRRAKEDPQQRTTTNSNEELINIQTVIQEVAQNSNAPGTAGTITSSSNTSTSTTVPSLTPTSRSNPPPSILSHASVLTHANINTKIQSRNRATRAMKITLAVLLTAGALAVTGGLAAPAILAGISTLAGALGVGSISAAVATAITFINTTAGAVTMLSLFGVTGAGLAGYRMSRRFGDLNTFRFECLSHESRMSREGKEVLSVIRKIYHLPNDTVPLNTVIEADKKTVDPKKDNSVNDTMVGGGLHVTICVSGLVTHVPEPVIFPVSKDGKTNNGSNRFLWFTNATSSAIPDKSNDTKETVHPTGNATSSSSVPTTTSSTPNPSSSTEKPKDVPQSFFGLSSILTTTTDTNGTNDTRASPTKSEYSSTPTTSSDSASSSSSSSSFSPSSAPFTFPTNFFMFTTETIPEDYKNVPLPILRDTYESRDYVVPWGGFDNADKRLHRKEFTVHQLLKGTKSVTNDDTKKTDNTVAKPAAAWFTLPVMFKPTGTSAKPDTTATSSGEGSTDAIVIPPTVTNVNSMEPVLPVKDKFTIQGWDITLYRWKTIDEGIQYMKTENIQQSPGQQAMRDIYDRLVWYGNSTITTLCNFPTTVPAKEPPLMYWIYNDEEQRIGWIGVGNTVQSTETTMPKPTTDSDDDDTKDTISPLSPVYEAEIRLCIWDERNWNKRYGRKALRTLSYILLTDEQSIEYSMNSDPSLGPLVSQQRPTKLIFRPHWLCGNGLSCGEKVGFKVMKKLSITLHDTRSIPPVRGRTVRFDVGDKDLDNVSNVANTIPPPSSTVTMPFFIMELFPAALANVVNKQNIVRWTVDESRAVTPANTIVTEPSVSSMPSSSVALPDINVLETLDSASKALSTYGNVEAGDIQSNRGWLRVAVPYGESYSLVYEPPVLYELGDGIMGFVRQFLTDRVINYALMHTVLNTLLASFTLPSYAMQIASLLDSPWAVAMNRSATAGRALAHALLDGAHGHRPVTLVGWGMGARTIFKCCTELAEEAEKLNQDTYKINQALRKGVHPSKLNEKKDIHPFDRCKTECPIDTQGKWLNQRLPYTWDFIPTAEQAMYREYDRSQGTIGNSGTNSDTTGGWFVIPSFTTATYPATNKGEEKATPVPRKRLSPYGIVQDVFILGAPIRADPEPWLAVRKVVAGRVVNAFSRRDFVLRLAYRLNQLQWNVAGLRPIGAPFDPVKDFADEAATLPDPTPVVRAVLPISTVALPPLPPLFTNHVAVTSPKSTDDDGTPKDSTKNTNDNDEVSLGATGSNNTVTSQMNGGYKDDGDVVANQYMLQNMTIMETGRTVPDNMVSGLLTNSTMDTTGENSENQEPNAENEEMIKDNDNDSVVETTRNPRRTDTITTTTTNRTLSNKMEHGQWGSSLAPCFPSIAWWRGIENVDLTLMVPGHLDYRTKLEEIMNYLGIEKSAA